MLTEFTHHQHDDITSMYNMVVMWNNFWYQVENDAMILRLFIQVLTTTNVVAGDVSA